MLQPMESELICIERKLIIGAWSIFDVDYLANGSLIISYQALLRLVHYGKDLIRNIILILLSHALSYSFHFKLYNTHGGKDC